MDVFICPPDHAHDATSTCYCVHKCRCGDCRRGRAEYEYWRKHMREAGRELLVDATGTRRRLQALTAIGWSSREVAARAGLTQGWVSHLLTTKRVTHNTAARVREIYDRMSMTIPDPQTKDQRGSVSKAKRWARDHGWAPPLAWDEDTIDDPSARPASPLVLRASIGQPFLTRVDEVAVAAAVAGERPTLSPLERRETVRVLNARAWSAARIAGWIGCDPKTVERIRAELHLPVPDQSTIRSAA